MGQAAPRRQEVWALGHMRHMTPSQHLGSAALSSTDITETLEQEGIHNHRALGCPCLFPVFVTVPIKAHHDDHRSGGICCPAAQKEGAPGRLG